MTDQELIPVTKHGEYLEVHPVALAQHEAIGWVKCARQEPADHEPEGAKKATVAELREALTAKGIEIPEGAKKAELQALMDGAE